MLKLFRLFAFLGILASSSAVNAASYAFSYTLLDSSNVSGTFDGTANGNLITDISNLSVYITDSFGIRTGFPNNGNLYTYDLSVTPSAAVISFDGLQTNLLASDDDFYDFNLIVSTILVIAPFNGGATDAINYLGNAIAPNGEGNGEYSASRWSLTAVSAVPEPASYAMLLCGLALVGALARRRS